MPLFSKTPLALAEDTVDNRIYKAIVNAIPDMIILNRIGNERKTIRQSIPGIQLLVFSVVACRRCFML